MCVSVNGCQSVILKNENTLIFHNHNRVCASVNDACAEIVRRVLRVCEYVSVVSFPHIHNTHAETRRGDKGSFFMCATASGSGAAFTQMDKKLG